MDSSSLGPTLSPVIKGQVWKYGDDVNTDLIFPGKYTYTMTEKKEMASVALEDLDTSFAKEVKRGDIIVAGKNWGCGSSREQAVTCLVEAGVGAIVAASFARIFYRNALNAGLLVITCKDAASNFNKGDSVALDLQGGELSGNGKRLPFPPLSESARHLIQEGGLIPYLRKKLAGKNATPGVEPS